VFSIQGNRLRGSCCLLSGQSLLTAAHLGFNHGCDYKINGLYLRDVPATCTFISKDYDFAILHSEQLPVLFCPTGILTQGDDFYTMVSFWDLRAFCIDVNFGECNKLFQKRVQNTKGKRKLEKNSRFFDGYPTVCRYFGCELPYKIRLFVPAIIKCIKYTGIMNILGFEA
jgi:hypothetical protein